MKSAMLAAVVILCCLALGAEDAPRKASSAQRAGSPQGAPAPRERSGERLFEIHCIRCHQPPLSLSPKAARIVLRHMRVRALLPADEEQRILEYIAP